MFYVYAISSLNRNYIYVGLTSDLNARVKRHNQKREKTTKAYTPFELIYAEEVATRTEARKTREILEIWNWQRKIAENSR